MQTVKLDYTSKDRTFNGEPSLYGETAKGTVIAVTYDSETATFIFGVYTEAEFVACEQGFLAFFDTYQEGPDFLKKHKDIEILPSAGIEDFLKAIK